MKQLKTHQTQWGKPGNMALFGALSIGLVLGFAGLVIDMGMLYWAKTRTQNTAEAAALAAVERLDRTSAGLSSACNNAVALVTANERVSDEFAFVADCGSPFASTNEIVFGVWDEATGEFDANVQDATFINAVRVNIYRSTDKNNAVAPLLMGILQIFGSDAPTGVTVSSSAVAIVQDNLPASEANIFPMAASSCGIFDDNGQVACGREVIIGDAPLGESAGSNNCTINPGDCVIDSSGNHFNWTSGTTSNGNTDIFRDMANALITCLTTNVCAPSIHLDVGDQINIDGGNRAGTFNSNQALAPNYLATHGAIDTQIAVFDGGNDCSNSSSDALEVIVGFASFRIREIVSNGSNKFIRGEIICDTDINQPGDGSAENFGTFGEANGILVK